MRRLSTESVTLDEWLPGETDLAVIKAAATAIPNANSTYWYGLLYEENILVPASRIRNIWDRAKAGGGLRIWLGVPEEFIEHYREEPLADARHRLVFEPTGIHAELNEETNELTLTTYDDSEGRLVAVDDIVKLEEAILHSAIEKQAVLSQELNAISDYLVALKETLPRTTAAQSARLAAIEARLTPRRFAETGLHEECKAFQHQVMYAYLKGLGPGLYATDRRFDEARLAWEAAVKLYYAVTPRDGLHYPSVSWLDPALYNELDPGKVANDTVWHVRKRARDRATAAVERWASQANVHEMFDTVPYNLPVPEWILYPALTGKRLERPTGLATAGLASLLAAIKAADPSRWTWRDRLHVIAKLVKAYDGALPASPSITQMLVRDWFKVTIGFAWKFDGSDATQLFRHVSITDQREEALEKKYGMQWMVAFIEARANVDGGIAALETSVSAQDRLTLGLQLSSRRIIEIKPDGTFGGQVHETVHPIDAAEWTALRGTHFDAAVAGP